MAYGFYVAAALIADAKVPQFFRGHLFDGFAPAAAVGLLIDRFPGRYVNQFQARKRPFVTSLLYFLAGAVVFGGIAAAAVFSSNTSEFPYTVLWCGLFGGLTFPIAYISTVRISKVQPANGNEQFDAPATAAKPLLEDASSSVAPPTLPAS
jgi:MFS family permease